MIVNINDYSIAELIEIKKRQAELDEQHKRNAAKKYLKDYADNKGWKHIKILDEKDGFDDFYMLIAYTDETMTTKIKDPDNGIMIFFNEDDYKNYKENPHLNKLLTNAKLYSEVCSKEHAEGKKIPKTSMHDEIEK